MSYSNRSARDRYHDGSLAYNEAEAAVERYFIERDRPLERYGFQGVSTERAVATTWPSVIRHSPDYITFGRFVEVKSCWDATIKLKKEDIEAMGFWHRLMPLWVAIYQGSTGRIITCDLPTLKWACAQDDTQIIVLDKGTKGEKEAYEVRLDHLLRRRVADPFAAQKVHPVVEPFYVGELPPSLY